MSKIIPMDLIKSMSGRVCSHSDTYFAVKHGTQYTAKICNPRTKPFTEEELDRQAKFRQAHAAAVTRKNDTAHQAEDMAKFKNQRKYKTLLGFLTATAYANTSKSEDNGTWTTTWAD